MNAVGAAAPPAVRAGGREAGERGAWVLVRTGGRTAAIPVDEAREAMRPLPIEPIDGAPPFVRGLALVRGEAIPVVDLARLLGAASDGARWLTVRAGARRVALAADEVVGVAWLGPSSVSPLPSLAQAADAGAIEALAVRDGTVVALLAASRLVPAEAWEALDRARGGAA